MQTASHSYTETTNVDAHSIILKGHPCLGVSESVHRWLGDSFAIRHRSSTASDASICATLETSAPRTGGRTRLLLVDTAKSMKYLQ